MRCNERVASASSRPRRFCKGLKKLLWAVDAPGGGWEWEWGCITWDPESAGGGRGGGGREGVW